MSQWLILIVSMTCIVWSLQTKHCWPFLFLLPARAAALGALMWWPGEGSNQIFKRWRKLSNCQCLFAMFNKKLSNCEFSLLQSCHLLVDLLDDEDGVLEGLDLIGWGLSIIQTHLGLILVATKTKTSSHQSLESAWVSVFPNTGDPARSSKATKFRGSQFEVTEPKRCAPFGRNE